MIKSINRRYSTINVRPKKSVKTKPTKKVPKEETNNSIKDKYLLQTIETNILSLKNQTMKLQDDIFKLKKENSLKENQIDVQKKFLLDKEKKINKRQIAIFPYSSDYQKYRIENEKAKQENTNLNNEIAKLQQQLIESYDELEDINNKSYFNNKDTFEVQQLEIYNVEMLKLKVHALSTVCSCSQQKIDEYQQIKKQYDEQEKEITNSINETTARINKLHERKRELQIQSEIENSEMKNQQIFVEHLESEVKKAEEMISSANEIIEKEVEKAQIDYETFISEIDSKKERIFQRKKNILIQRQHHFIFQDFKFNDEKIEKKIEESDDSAEEEINDCKFISEKIYEQLSDRGDSVKTLNIQFQTKKVKNSTCKSRIENNLKAKLRKLEDLKEKFKAIQKKEEEILFQKNKIVNLKEKSLKINEAFNIVSNRKENIDAKLKLNIEKLQNLEMKKKLVDQKEECLVDQEEKLKEKNNFLIQKEKNIDAFEQKNQIREKNILQLEKEAQMLKDKLSTQMKLLENQLLVTPFHEKIGLTA